MRTHFYFANLFALLISLTFASFAYGQTYCNPTYSKGCSNWRMTKVAIPQANFNDSSFSSSNCSQSDKTSTIINMSASSSYDISVTTTGWISCGVAIDFNQNGNFDDAGETLYMPNYAANNPNTYSGNFTIPSSVNPGSYRMRIWNREANSGSGQSACGSYSYGTWVDYTVNITPLLSTSEALLPKTKVYPNPVSDILNIEDSNTIQSVEIYDFNGKLVRNDLSLNKKKISVSLSNLVSGAYTAKIKSAKGAKTLKFIKK